MELLVTRNWKKADYTIGRLYVQGSLFCNTLENTVREIKPNGKGKIAGKTAIPAGRYEVTMNVISPKYSKKKAFAWCEGRLPRLLNVPYFEGVLIHSGNTAADTDGCLLVGENKVKGGLVNSMATLKRLWQLLEEARKRGEEIWITYEN